MMVIVPIIAFLSIFLCRTQRSLSQDSRRSFLRAVIIWGIYMVAATELLSLFKAVTPAGLALAWSLPLIYCSFQIRRWNETRGAIKLPSLKLPDGFLNRLLLLLVLVIVVTTWVIAFLSPTTTTDSLTYHMSRVAHWAQEKSIHHYATGIPRQNYMSPGAEMGILQFYVLLGGDRMANFIEWFAMVASLVGVSFIAKQLGAKTAGQIVAVVFTATLPQGLAQASSTMTDYVTAFWIVCVASESLDLLQRKSPRAPRSFFFLAASTGMALLSKPTALVYLLPFAILLAISLIRERSMVRIASISLLVICTIAIINAGYLSRNYVTYQNVLGPSNKVDAFPKFLDTSSYEVTGILYWKGFISTLMRNAYLHGGTPIAKINKILYRLVRSVHVKIGIGMNNPETTAHRTWGMIRPTTAEARAGNFYHGILILVTFLLLVILWKRFRSGNVRSYTITVTSTFLIFSYIMLFSAYASRYQLPFFVLYAPAVAYVLSEFFPRIISYLICIGLIITSWSWVVGVQSRPLIPQKVGVTSILDRPREDYLSWYDGQSSLFPLTELIREDHCSQIGLIMPGTSHEYLIWSSLGAPREDLRIEWLSYTSASKRYAHEDFQPCAVICSKCPDDWEDVRGLPTVYDQSPYRLFLNVGREQ